MCEITIKNNFKRLEKNNFNSMNLMFFLRLNYQLFSKFKRTYAASSNREKNEGAQAK